MPIGLEEWTKISQILEPDNKMLLCHLIYANIYLGFLLLENHLLFHFTYLFIQVEGFHSGVPVVLPSVC